MIGGGIAAVLLIAIGAFVVLGGDDDGGGGAGSLEGVKAATVQILTDGSFVDLEGATVSSAGAGTGFIIDESGIAVTNNHVVTGAASVQVRVGGEDTELDAEVLGVSECSDLAVIDIEGDGYPTLTFAAEDPDVGTAVSVAGFPLGDPEYTLTDGTISKAEAATDTNWASVEGALETTAKINPGNSGGPLVNEKGEVVGVNYAANDQTDQNLSIKASLAQKVIEVLREGKDEEALGMNTQALVSDDGSQSGIFVAAVSPGTPAAQIGVEGGDLIVEMNGTTVGDDGTMGDYCDILSSAGEEGVIDVTLIRTSTGEVFSGEFNGSDLESQGGVSTPGGPGGSDGPGGPATSGDTQVVSSSSGGIAAEAPAEWESDIRDDGFNVGPDVEAFNTSFGAPGASVRLIPGEGDVDAVADEFLSQTGGDTACDESAREAFDSGVYTGTQIGLVCGGDGSEAVLIVGTSGSGNTVLVLVQGSSESDFQAGNVVVETVQEL